MYSELRADRIEETAAALKRRIHERFPGSGLGGIAAEVHRLAAESGTVVERLRRPIWPLRVGAALGIVGIAVLAVVLGVIALRAMVRVDSLADLLQATEAATNEMIFLALAVFFLISLETRVKRKLALTELHRLRSVVHIVDMHQLTKDPEHIFSPSADTESSPKRVLTRFELSRYLDYCTELLSLSSKVAALYVQHLNDPVVLDAVNDIETLAASLSNKIWQKIMILDRALPAARTE